MEDPGSIPGWEDTPGEGKGYPLQYSGLENSMDCIVHGFTKSDTTEQPSLSLSFILDFGGCLVVFMNMVYRWICCLKVDFGKRELLSFLKS